jgi:pentatricopeptide repeat protein
VYKVNLIFEKIQLEEAFELVEKLTNAANNMYDQEKLESKTPKGNLAEYISDVEIYNKLMFAYAQSGKTSKIHLIFKKMRSYKDKTKEITPNLSSYTAALQSIGYQLRNEDTDLDASKSKLQVHRILMDIQRLGVIMSESVESYFKNKSLNLVYFSKLNLNEISINENYSDEQKLNIKAVST